MKEIHGNQTEERGELCEVVFVARAGFGRCVCPYFSHFTPFYHFYSDLARQKPNQAPPCVKCLEHGIVLAHEGSPSPRRKAWNTSRVRGMNPRIYAGAVMPQEECPMVGRER